MKMSVLPLEEGDSGRPQSRSPQEFLRNWTVWFLNLLEQRPGLARCPRIEKEGKEEKRAVPPSPAGLQPVCVGPPQGGILTRRREGSESACACVKPELFQLIITDQRGESGLLNEWF